MNDEDERKAAFLRELTELSRKHRIIVSGCGCCGSPSLDPMRPDEESGAYAEDCHDPIRWERA